MLQKFFESMGAEPKWRKATDTTVKNYRDSGIIPATSSPKLLEKPKSPIPASPELKVNGGVVKVIVHPNERIAPPSEYGKPARLLSNYQPTGRNEAFLEKSIGELLVMQSELIEEINFRKRDWRDHIRRTMAGNQFTDYAMAKKMSIVQNQTIYTPSVVSDILNNPENYEHTAFYDMEEAMKFLYQDSFVVVDINSPLTKENKTYDFKKSHRSRVLQENYRNALSQSESALMTGKVSEGNVR